MSQPEMFCIVGRKLRVQSVGVVYQRSIDSQRRPYSLKQVLIRSAAARSYVQSYVRRASCPVAGDPSTTLDKLAGKRGKLMHMMHPSSGGVPPCSTFPSSSQKRGYSANHTASTAFPRSLIRWKKNQGPSRENGRSIITARE